MDIDTHIKAAGFLLVAGFIGGFLVVHKASAMFHTQSLEPEHAASADPEAPRSEASKAAEQGPLVAVTMDGNDEPGAAVKAPRWGMGQSQTTRNGDDDSGRKQGSGSSNVEQEEKELIRRRW